jgi:hypothetical protein
LHPDPNEVEQKPEENDADTKPQETLDISGNLEGGDDQTLQDKVKEGYDNEGHPAASP